MTRSRISLNRRPRSQRRKKRRPGRGRPQESEGAAGAAGTTTTETEAEAEAANDDANDYEDDDTVSRESGGGEQIVGAEVNTGAAAAAPTMNVGTEATENGDGEATSDADDDDDRSKGEKNKSEEKEDEKKPASLPPSNQGEASYASAAAFGSSIERIDVSGKSAKELRDDDIDEDFVFGDGGGDDGNGLGRLVSDSGLDAPESSEGSEREAVENDEQGNKGSPEDVLEVKEAAISRSDKKDRKYSEAVAVAGGSHEPFQEEFQEDDEEIGGGRVEMEGTALIRDSAPYRTVHRVPECDLSSDHCANGGDVVISRSPPSLSSSSFVNSPDRPPHTPSSPPVRRQSRSFLSLSPLPSLRAGSTAGAVANLCGATLGAGVLSLPFAFSRAGLVTGMALLSLSALGTVRSIDLLIDACVVAGEDGYSALALRLCGPRVVWLVEGCIFVFCFGTAVAYVVAVGDMLQQGVIETMGERLPSFVDREFVMTLFWTAIMFPLSLLKRIDKLRYASVVGIASVLFLVFAAVVHSVRDLAFAGTPAGGDTGDVMLLASSLRDVIRACPIMIFAFSCQVNVCSIYNGLTPGGDTGSADIENGVNGERNTPAESISKATKMARVTRLGILLCITFYIFMGVFGYLDFGKFTQDNVLKNYCIHDTKDPLMILAFICITITVIMAFPINILPARSTIQEALKRHSSSVMDENAMNGDEEVDGGSGMEGGVGDLSEPLLPRHAMASDGSGGIAVDDNGFGDIDDVDFEVIDAPSDDGDVGEIGSAGTRASHNALSDLKHAFLTLLIAGLALLTALAVPDISVVFGLMGGTASSIINFILPGTFTLRLMAEVELSTVGGGGASEDTNDSGRRHPLRDSASRPWKRLEAWVLIVVGSVIGILSTAVTVHSIFYEDPIPSTCSHGSEV